MSKNSKTIKNLITWFFIIFGNAVVAFTICYFVLPTGLIMGGVTGISLISNHYFDLNIATTTYILNAIFLIVGLVVKGKKFALGIIISTFAFPTFLWLFQSVPNLYYSGDDIMLATIFSGLLIGLGGGMIIRSGSSSGGIEVMSIIISGKTGISLALIINVVDTLILALQAFFSSSEEILYGILLTLVLTLVLNKVLLIGETKIQVMVISKNHNKIRDEITNTLNLGCTFFDVTTGYKREKQRAVMCVLNRRNLTELHNIIIEIDPQAFVITNEVHDVKGRGFSLPKV